MSSKKKSIRKPLTLNQWKFEARRLAGELAGAQNALRASREQRDHAEATANKLAEELEETSTTLQHQIAAYNNLQAEIGKANDRTRKQVRVLRLVEIAGEREAVEAQVRQSIHGTVDVRKGQVMITAVTLHEYPEILNVARVAPSVLVSTDRSLDGELAERNSSPNRSR